MNLSKDPTKVSTVSIISVIIGSGFPPVKRPDMALIGPMAFLNSENSLLSTSWEGHPYSSNYLLFLKKIPLSNPVRKSAESLSLIFILKMDPADTW